ncbi:MAG: hypothetical protein PQJ60_07335 [Spirochaetales bacterium]|nr:hypothetical protein [Spirochaetales bacterium]
MRDKNPAITTELQFDCSREEIFNFVTVPDNWVGTHPATKEVKGDTHSPAIVGKSWIEVIDPVWRDDLDVCEAEWTTTDYEYPSMWSFCSKNIYNTSADVYITYHLIEKDGGTLFQRHMSVTMEDQEALSHMAKDMSSQSDMQNEYLLLVKKALNA